jgi:hypothetical protein
VLPDRRAGCAESMLHSLYMMCNMFSIAQNVDEQKSSSAAHRSPATGTSSAETGARRTLALPLCAMPIVDGGVASPRPAAGNAKRLAYVYILLRRLSSGQDVVRRSVDDFVREAVAAGPEWLPHGMQGSAGASFARDSAARHFNTP